MLELNHKKLNVWKVSTELVVNIYAITDNYPKSELYCLTSQMKRAAVSISSNISEGAARFSKKERKRFFEIARSSLVELDMQMKISLKLKFTDDRASKEIGRKTNVVFAMLSNLIKSTK
jgi:four helix bundle protein